MSLTPLLKELWGWVETAYSEIHLALESEPVTQMTPLDTLTGIILAQAANFGPSPTTGGQLHAVNATDARGIAACILEYAPKYGLEPAFVLAGLSGESRCDPKARNPNNQDAKKGESAADAFRHMDCGIAQFDGATLLQGDGIFEELKGLSIEEIEAKAFDYTWAIPKFCEFVSKLINDTKAEVLKDPSLLDNVKNGSLDVLATEGYNAGETGAKEMASKDEDLSYGERWLANFHTWDAIMKGGKE